MGKCIMGPPGVKVPAKVPIMSPRPPEPSPIHCETRSVGEDDLDQARHREGKDHLGKRRHQQLAAARKAVQRALRTVGMEYEHADDDAGHEHEPKAAVHTEPPCYATPALPHDAPSLFSNPSSGLTELTRLDTNGRRFYPRGTTLPERLPVSTRRAKPPHLPFQ